jgi:diadenosine tetraphosphate (Ap4A) HIT family hydrolase
VDTHSVISPLSEEFLFCLEGCRSYAQYHHMRREFEQGKCPFCAVDRTRNEVLWEDEHIFAWHVPTPFMRSELAVHWLIVPKRHVRFEADLSAEEWLSLLQAKRYMHKRFMYVGGLTHVREGDMHLNAGSVPHLHYNTFVPNCTSEVRIPVFKDPKEREHNRTRAADFCRRYEAGEEP